MISFVLFFFAKSKELSPSWRDAHTERELLQNRLKILQLDGKLDNNKEGICSQISHGDARLNNEEKQESALPSLDSGEREFEKN